MSSKTNLSGDLSQSCKDGISMSWYKECSYTCCMYDHSGCWEQNQCRCLETILYMSLNEEHRMQYIICIYEVFIWWAWGRVQLDIKWDGMHIQTIQELTKRVGAMTQPSETTERSCCLDYGFIAVPEYWEYQYVLLWSNHVTIKNVWSSPNILGLKAVNFVSASALSTLSVAPTVTLTW